VRRPAQRLALAIDGPMAGQVLDFTGSYVLCAASYEYDGADRLYEQVIHHYRAMQYNIFGYLIWVATVTPYSESAIPMSPDVAKLLLSDLAIKIGSRADTGKGREDHGSDTPDPEAPQAQVGHGRNDRQGSDTAL
jgi:hypothetical protein